jgi:hypothetical protein
MVQGPARVSEFWFAFVAKIAAVGSGKLMTVAARILMAAVWKLCMSSISSAGVGPDHSSAAADLYVHWMSEQTSARGLDLNYVGRTSLQWAVR